MSESSIKYDARKGNDDWINLDYDDSKKKRADEFGYAGCYPWNTLIERPIPMFKDFGLKDYEDIKIIGDTVFNRQGGFG